MGCLLAVYGPFMTGSGLSRTMKVDLVYNDIQARILERGIILMHPLLQE